MKLPSTESRVEPSEFYPVDLHVHTPASKDYKGQDSDDEYIRLLRSAHQQGLRVIAIGDHNTFKGYERFLKLKEDFQRDIESLQRYAESPEAVKELSDKLDLFSNLLILPSVELEIKPGVHLIFIFDNATPIGQLQGFLRDAGLTREDEGASTSMTVISWDIETAMREAADLGGITLAAHADSDKGIYNALTGSYRACIFRSEYLYAICFKNPRQKDIMKSLLRQKEYRRATSVSFIQVSDFHGAGDAIGSGHLYLKLSAIDFHSLKMALRNPDECASWPEKPETMTILEGLVGDARNMRLPLVSTKSEKKQFANAVCAFANCADRTIVIGATPEGNLVGVPTDKVSAELIRVLAESSVSPPPTYTLTIYPFGDGTVLALRVTKGPAALYRSRIDQHFYLLVEGEIKLGSAAEITQLVEDNLIRKSRSLLSASRNRLDAIAASLAQHYDALEAVSVARKIERASLPLEQIMDRKSISRAVSIPTSVRYNGLPDGNMIVANQCLPRQEAAYLRFTAIKTEIAEPLLQKAGIERFDGEKIILCPGGAAYFDDNTGIYVVTKEFPGPMLLTLKETYKDRFSTKFIFACLKSAIPLWYAASNFNSVNLHKDEIALNLPLPLNAPEELQQEVCELVDEIIALEQQFLREEVELSKRVELPKQIDRTEQPSPSDIQDWVSHVEEQVAVLKELITRTREHNLKAGQIMTILEGKISTLYDLTSKDIEIIKRALQAHRLSLFYAD